MKDTTTLAQQFKGEGINTDEMAYNAMRFILNGNYAVQKRDNIDSDKWHDCTFKELVRGILEHEVSHKRNLESGSKHHRFFDNWSMEFYRVKPWTDVTPPDKFVKITDKIEFKVDKD